MFKNHRNKRLFYKYLNKFKDIFLLIEQTKTIDRRFLLY